MTSTTPGVLSYPFGPAEELRLHPKYGELRAEQPVARVSLPYGGEAWLVTRYADIRTVLADPRFSRAATVDRDDLPRTTPLPMDGKSLLGMDPPNHTRLRRLAAKAFTARRIELLRPRAQQIVDGLLDDMIAGGPPADLAAELAWPLPITMICELLGVPFDDRDQFRTWTDQGLALSATSKAAVEQAREELQAYLAGLVARRRAEPADDLLTDLVRARDADDRLSEAEIVRLGTTLLVAGHETTANQLGNFTYTLLTRPELWRRLVADPALVPQAVEELMRITPLGANAGFPWVAVEDVELSGQLIRAGDTVVTATAAGNRDGEVFDHPEQIDFDRADIPHIGFGHGAHHCLGAALARLELRVALVTLVSRLPDLRLAVPAEDVAWRADRLIRGVRALPVSW